MCKKSVWTIQNAQKEEPNNARKYGVFSRKMSRNQIVNISCINNIHLVHVVLKRTQINL